MTNIHEFTGKHPPGIGEVLGTTDPQEIHDKVKQNVGGGYDVNAIYVNFLTSEIPTALVHGDENKVTRLFSYAVNEYSQGLHSNESKEKLSTAIATVVTIGASKASDKFKKEADKLLAHKQDEAQSLGNKGQNVQFGRWRKALALQD